MMNSLNNKNNNNNNNNTTSKEEEEEDDKIELESLPSSTSSVNSETGIGANDDDDDRSSKYYGDDSQRDEVHEVEKLAVVETGRMRIWRILLLVVICVLGAGISHMTWAILSTEEEDNHSDAFGHFANSIQDLTRLRVEHVYRGLRGFGETISAHAQRNGEVWPQVTLPNFEVEGRHLRSQTMIEYVAFTPLVLHAERDAYERYAHENQWWIEESHNITLTEPGHQTEAEDYINVKISGAITVPCDTGFCPSPNTTEHAYLPLWQASPPPFNPAAVGRNINNEGSFERSMFAVIESRDVVMGPVFSTDVLSSAAVKEESHDAFHDQFVSNTITDGIPPPTTSNERPHFVASAPAFHVLGDGYSGVGGVIIAVIAIDAYMSNLLPEGVDGIDLVVRNTCGQSYTYALSGGVAGYIGEGDFHDAAYDDSEVVVGFQSFLDPELSKSLPGHCVYTFSLYPTDTFVNEYKSGTPIFFGCMVAVTFASMIIVFFIYDCMGRRRNDKVVNAAARSNAIVSSLFPSKVRDQLIEEANTKIRPASAQARLKSFVNDNSEEHIPTGDSNEMILPGKPLAELYPESTVMFADVVGFTAWSSQREPSQVFTLLETLYRAFDKAAKKRRIFKIETIGDCYVAVAGIPEPRNDHAVAMCRFASHCKEQMHVLVHLLQDTLGPDTGDLTLRIGLHSGPCTAGVLRGDKSRFQLFGDTVNTASRIESTGARDRIQLSQATADLLILAGKPDWIIAREDKIHAKGKGELQTYWLAMSKYGSRSSKHSIPLSTTSTPTANGGDQAPSSSRSFPPEEPPMLPSNGTTATAGSSVSSNSNS